MVWEGIGSWCPGTAGIIVAVLWDIKIFVTSAAIPAHARERGAERHGAV